jgi:hypothetical protein
MTALPFALGSVVLLAILSAPYATIILSVLLPLYFTFGLPIPLHHALPLAPWYSLHLGYFHLDFGGFLL